MVVGLLLAILIGLSLGLMGGGGSILTVPILVYVLDYSPKDSIALSLAIVGVTSLFGSIAHFRNKNINFKVAGIFGPIAMIGTYLGTKLSVYLSGSTQLIIFAVVMLIASFFMFKGRKEVDEKSLDKETFKYFTILIIGIFVGILTGIVGVGGGFMIVPALVLLANIPMKKAIGTSLIIISLNSFTGFLGYLDEVAIDWSFLLKFSSFAVIGIIIGSYLVKYIPQQKLKKAFSVFLVVMGVFILYKNHAVFIS
jgi:uncharacterized membrane protein YfcA